MTCVPAPGSGAFGKSTVIGGTSPAIHHKRPLGIGIHPLTAWPVHPAEKNLRSMTWLSRIIWSDSLVPSNRPVPPNSAIWTLISGLGPRPAWRARASAARIRHDTAARAGFLASAAASARRSVSTPVGSSTLRGSGCGTRGSLPGRNEAMPRPSGRGAGQGDRAGPVLHPTAPSAEKTAATITPPNTNTRFMRMRYSQRLVTSASQAESRMRPRASTPPRRQNALTITPACLYGNAKPPCTPWAQNAPQVSPHRRGPVGV